MWSCCSKTNDSRLSPLLRSPAAELLPPAMPSPTTGVLWYMCMYYASAPGDILQYMLLQRLLGNLLGRY